MTDSDALLAEANRAAHRLARTLIKELAEDLVLRDSLPNYYPALQRDLDAYEEAERRARAKPEAAG